MKQAEAPATSNFGTYRVHEHNVVRIPPQERPPIAHSVPARFYSPDPHYFGFRISVLPPSYRRVKYFGVYYYVYDNVYYRPHISGGYYYVCRPPFGVAIDRSLRAAAFHAVRFAYYHNVYRTFSAIDANNRYIDRQNRIIAQNNATIARQNSVIAMNLNDAQSSYDLASRLGLVQSYAYADKEYFYEDGVFYIINAKGKYEVIVPPAGALVESLPEDYGTINIGGTELYRVEDTVYRITMQSGRPYLEVLGQMYGSLASQYSY